LQLFGRKNRKLYCLFVYTSDSVGAPCEAAFCVAGELVSCPGVSERNGCTTESKVTSTTEMGLPVGCLLITSALLRRARIAKRCFGEEMRDHV
jgi:hypothetical protein